MNNNYLNNKNGMCRCLDDNKIIRISGLHGEIIWIEVDNERGYGYKECSSNKKFTDSHQAISYAIEKIGGISNIKNFSN